MVRLPATSVNSKTYSWAAVFELNMLSPIAGMIFLPNLAQSSHAVNDTAYDVWQVAGQPGRCKHSEINSITKESQTLSDHHVQHTLSDHHVQQ